MHDSRWSKDLQSRLDSWSLFRLSFRNMNHRLTLIDFRGLIIETSRQLKSNTVVQLFNILMVSLRTEADSETWANNLLLYWLTITSISFLTSQNSLRWCLALQILSDSLRLFLGQHFPRNIERFSRVNPQEWATCRSDSSVLRSDCVILHKLTCENVSK